jgi:hypothetical protein
MSVSKLGSIWRDSVRPVRRFYRAPDRLRRLSVNSDKCPSHVFRVTEANRFRNAFDRFGSRLYAASGYGSGDAAEAGMVGYPSHASLEYVCEAQVSVCRRYTPRHPLLKRAGFYPIAVDGHDLFMRAAFYVTRRSALR